MLFRSAAPSLNWVDISGPRLSARSAGGCLVEGLVTSIVGAFPPRRSYSARLPTTRSTTMTRLRQEQRRLYAPAGPAGADDFALIDDQGRVRALVIELRRPADWSAASRLWQGVQADLKWPAPAIAVIVR